MTEPSGSDKTRAFYDKQGWTVRDGASVDQILFGVKEDGPIRIELHQKHLARVRSLLQSAGPDLDLLECGCGGNPESQLFELCARYTGVDFSTSGLELAATKMENVGIPYRFQQADACNLPFDDQSFDAVYSAHMIYHLPDPAAQEAALGEMLRVLKPNGMAVILAANPRPLLFPVRFLKRLLSDAPILGAMLNRLRREGPIPYNPMPIGWMRKRLERSGEVELLTSSIPTTGFHQNVTEVRGPGRLAWKFIRWLDLEHPRASAYLGNFVIYAVRKPAVHAD